jgi:hypothetical protein
MLARTLSELRRRRLQIITSGLPASFWGVVLVGALMSISLTWLFMMQSRRLHMTTLLVDARCDSEVESGTCID